MIETTKPRGEDGVLVTFCEFTPSETGAMAKFVMDCLCLPWIDTFPQFQDLLYELFHRCAGGKDMTSTHALKLADKYERYFKYGLPTFPKIRDGGRLMCPKDIHGKAATAWLEKEKAGLWRDQWENHYIKNKDDPDDRSKNIRTVGRFWKFPGDEADEVFLKKQHERELIFWDEVDSRQAEYVCSRRATDRLSSNLTGVRGKRRSLPTVSISSPGAPSSTSRSRSQSISTTCR